MNLNESGLNRLTHYLRGYDDGIQLTKGFILWMLDKFDNEYIVSVLTGSEHGFESLLDIYNSECESGVAEPPEYHESFED